MDYKQMIDKMTSIAETILYGYKYVHAGQERIVKTRRQQDSRTYISIQCFTLAGKFKGSYDCGYVDHANCTYVPGKDINLNNL